MASYTIDGNISGSDPLVLCDDSSSTSCSDFNFLHFYYDSSNPKSLYYNVTLNYSMRDSLGEYKNGAFSISPFISDYYFDFSDQSFVYFRLTGGNLSSLIDSDHPLSVDFLSSLGSGITPSGSISISENGTYDVTNYASAVVDVPEHAIQGDYHDDLQEIKGAIFIGCAVLLVIYFFYCIYRMIIKGSGVSS